MKAAGDCGDGVPGDDHTLNMVAKDLQAVQPVIASRVLQHNKS